MWAELDRDQGHVTNSSWILNHDCDWSIDQGLIWSDWSAGVWGIIHIRFTDRHQNHQWIKLKYFLKEEKRLYCNNNLINNQDQLSARGLRVCRLLWIRSLLWIIKLNWQTSSQTETTGSRSDPGLIRVWFSPVQSGSCWCGGGLAVDLVLVLVRSLDVRVSDVGGHTDPGSAASHEPLDLSLLPLDFLVSRWLLGKEHMVLVSCYTTVCVFPALCFCL